jgi:hypothetical protein
VNNSISLLLNPGYLPLDEGTQLDIRFTFRDYNNTGIPIARTLIGGTHDVQYDASSLVQKNLSIAWLEVKIW